MHDSIFLIPCAGRGERFARAGEEKLKPAIPVEFEGKTLPMVRHIAEYCPEGFLPVFAMRSMELCTVCQASRDYKQLVVGSTRGQSSTVLLALGKLLLPEDPLCGLDSEILIMNSDQVFRDYRLSDLVGFGRHYGTAATLVAKTDGDRRFSYLASPLPDGTFCGMVEKEPVSDFGVLGVYYFPNAGMLLDALVTQHAIVDSKELYLSGAFGFYPGATRYREIPLDRLVSWGTPEQLKEYEDELSHSQ